MDTVRLNSGTENCGVCSKSLPPNVGVNLKGCQDCICKFCLQTSILENAGNPRVSCPLNDCNGQIQLWEMKWALSKPEYLFYLEASGRLGGTPRKTNVNSPKTPNFSNTRQPSSSKNTPNNNNSDTMMAFRSSQPTNRISTYTPNTARNTASSASSSSKISSSVISPTFHLNSKWPEENSIIVTNKEIIAQKSERMKHQGSEINNVKCQQQDSCDYSSRYLEFAMSSSNCGFCCESLSPGNGISLRACSHIFCKDCLRQAVTESPGPQVPCPAGCRENLYESEIQALVTPAQYENYSRKQLLAATKDLPMVFQCKTPKCSGLCIPDSSAKIFLCDLCNKQNCLSCQNIHDGIPCDRWKRIRLEANLSGEQVSDQELLEKVDDFGYKQISRTVQEVLGRPQDNLALYYETAQDILDGVNVIPVQDDFECKICYCMTSDEGAGGGFYLRQCGHAFCRSCLENVVKLAEDTKIPCPDVGDDGPCNQFLTDAEIRSLASDEVLAKHARWGFSLAQDILQKIFRCLDNSCDGFWEICDDAPTGIYTCPLCKVENCVRCNTLHVTDNCSKFQEKLRVEAQRVKDEENRQVQKQNEQVSESEINRLINARQYMKCPKCGFVCEKISGCAHVVCLSRACQYKFNWYN